MKKEAFFFFFVAFVRAGLFPLSIHPIWGPATPFPPTSISFNPVPTKAGVVVRCPKRKKKPQPFCPLKKKTNFSSVHFHHVPSLSFIVFTSVLSCFLLFISSGRLQLKAVARVRPSVLPLCCTKTTTRKTKKQKKPTAPHLFSKNLPLTKKPLSSLKMLGPSPVSPFTRNFSHSLSFLANLPSSRSLQERLGAERDQRERERSEREREKAIRESVLTKEKESRNKQ